MPKYDTEDPTLKPYHRRTEDGANHLSQNDIILACGAVASDYASSEPADHWCKGCIKQVQQRYPADWHTLIPTEAGGV